MHLYVAGFNGFSQWPFEEKIIKSFKEVDFRKFFHIKEKVTDIMYSMNWSHNSYIINGKIYISGYYNHFQTTSYKMLSDIEEFRFTNLASSDDKYVLFFNKVKLEIWKYKLYQSEEDKVRMVPRFFDTDNSSCSDYDDDFNDGEHVIKIACGVTMNICLTSRGRLYCIPDEISTHEIEGRIVDIQCGYEHAVLLTDFGKVYTWGGGSRCQLGHGNLDNLESPKLVEGLAGISIIKIATGGWHTCAISTFGDLYTWGWNDQGQLGIYEPGAANINVHTSTDSSQHCDPVFHEAFVPDKEEDNEEPSCSKRPACDEDDSTSTKRSRTDLDYDSQLYSSHSIPYLVDIYDSLQEKMLEHNVINVACGSKHTIVILDNGVAMGAGSNKYGQLGYDPVVRKNYQYFTPLAIKCRNVMPICGDWTTTFMSLRFYRQ